MYGAPFSSVPTSSHARDVLALDRTAARASRRKRSVGVVALGGLGQEELDRHRWRSVDVVRGDDHAHAALAEDALDAVLAREDVTLPGEDVFLRRLFLVLGRH